MSEESTAQTTHPAAQPTPEVVQQPVQQAVTPAAEQTRTTATRGGDSPGETLLRELQALPERIVNALREAAPPAKPAATKSVSRSETTTAVTDKSQESTQKPGDAPPGMTRLAKWWFS